MSPLSNTATSAAAHPPTLWAPLWSSVVTLATPWSRAPSSSSVSTSMTPSGMRQSRPAEVSRYQWVGLPEQQVGWVPRSQPQRQGPETLLCVVDISLRGNGVGTFVAGGSPRTPYWRERAFPASPSLQPCAAGRSRTLQAWCSLQTGRSLMAEGRTASGVCMWRRTSASCWTSECECLGSGKPAPEAGDTSWPAHLGPFPQPVLP